MLVVMFLCFLVYGVGGFPACHTTCGEGLYCNNTMCHPCPHKFYQDQILHTDTQCKRWTEKPPDSNYVIKMPGTDISDAVWECDVGYYERQYTLNGYECVKNQPTQPSYSPTTTRYPDTSLKRIPDTTPSPAPIQEKTNNDLVIILSLVLGIVLVIFIVILSLYFCYRRRIFCFKNIKKKKQAGEPKEMEPLKVNSKYYNYFEKIINQLVPSKADEFIINLYGPSEKSRLDYVMDNEWQNNRDPIAYRTNTLVAWAVQNGKIDDEKVQNSLTLTGFPDLLRQINSGDTINIKNAPKRHELYDYLVENLKDDDTQYLLTNLPGQSNGFNAPNKFETEQDGEREHVEIAFANTLEEWFNRNPSTSLHDTILDILNSLNRNDILEDNEFKEHMQGLIDTSV